MTGPDSKEGVSRRPRTIKTRPTLLHSMARMLHFVHFPAALMFETVVSLGVGFFALHMARGFVRHPGAWALGTIAASFLLHRINAWAIDVRALDLTYASPGLALLGMTLPFLATIGVFIITPLLLPVLLPTVPWHLRHPPSRQD